MMDVPIHVIYIVNAMLHDIRVISDTGVTGRADELYRSVWDGVLKVRICDDQGRVHHFPADRVRCEVTA
jgi:hypothetical protein